MLTIINVPGKFNFLFIPQVTSCVNRDGALAILSWVIQQKGNFGASKIYVDLFYKQRVWERRDFIPFVRHACVLSLIWVMFFNSFSELPKKLHSKCLFKIFFVCLEYLFFQCYEQLVKLGNLTMQNYQFLEFFNT